MRTLRCLALLIFVLPVFSFAVSAQESKAPAEKKAQVEKKAAKPMSPEEKAAWDKMKAAGAPGEPHKFIARFEGVWKAVVKIWHAPGTEPEVSEGVSMNRMTMGGRYLRQSFRSSFMDTPFEGTGFMGYNNILKRYEGVWMDNMSTALMTSTGTLSADGKTLNSVSTYSDPQSGKEKKSRDVLRWIDEDKFVSEMYETGPDGKEFLMMEITYTRETRPERKISQPPVKK